MAERKRHTYFGYRKVNEAEKERLVQGVFSNVASNYDLMNDLMSFGLHHCWKAEFISELPPYNEVNLLDVAGGTGDISNMFLVAANNQGYRNVQATVCDLNAEMMERGKKKLATTLQSDLITWVRGNGERLPFDENSFDYYAISFGIRNFTNIPKALKEAYRVLRPGGKFACLEFSNVREGVIAKVYEQYSFNIVPAIGKIIAGDASAYQYLVESIRKFPKAPEFAVMVEDAGFSGVSYRKLTFGVVAIHIGYKPIHS
ncbi:MAG: bifunctional demethylmenaquinone methyltransferase/2-methoxy-6-polyprenyl-1,4-benzoquinol methylase UbiE [Proteobacteria bacterium]|nr:bifunctional demethylmenaquinone methyltransferase/2-methoxy-6-polyprenyl-1,4-benzoquinol methylase UbiE [Pseudomonadota bacterium]